MFLSSSVRHYVLLSLFWGQYQEQFQWMGWLKASVVTALILGVVHVVLFTVLLKKETPQDLTPSIKRQIEILGDFSPMSGRPLVGPSCVFLVWPPRTITISSQRSSRFWSPLTLLS